MKTSTLLVDDEVSYADALAERLEMRGFLVHVAYDGKGALESMALFAPGRLVLDLRLPDMDGVQVLQKVKEQWPETRVIVVTGHGSEADREACMALGAEDFLNKPVSIERLAKVLKGER